MKFHLPFQVTPSTVKISLNQSFLSIGSCFSNHLADYLTDHKYPVLNNPFGTLYNPYSIFTNISQAIDGEIQQDQIIKHNDLYHHWQLHSDFSSLKIESLITNLKLAQGKTLQSLENCDWLIITIGSAWVYQLLDKSMTVANCHKHPSNLFSLKLLESHEIISQFESLYSKLTTINPKLQIVLTVSPVRHIRFGLAQNTIGKAELLKACLKLKNLFNNVHYFESYELVMDVLRDYRFFKQDLIHPNDQAVEYVLTEFQKNYFSSESQDFIEKWRKIKTNMNHKALHPESIQHQQFLRKTISSLEEIKHLVDVSDELRTLQLQLK